MNRLERRTMRCHNHAKIQKKQLSLVFRPVTESSGGSVLPRRYFIVTYKAGKAPVIPLGSRVSMSASDHLLSGDACASLALKLP
ncbi:hypothetical protein EVAR_82688_1 [Eumeta japonica]|uniref:Uncharacterized protein n=1 Tax=Eumeta variegata TaxID=151549 RepID=A0A4C1VAR9_EUMVA|nr:hypothetical protein EVAR_82688_1 [Eumeta japonica]